jgi:hypothetical protein
VTPESLHPLLISDGLPDPLSSTWPQTSWSKNNPWRSSTKLLAYRQSLPMAVLIYFPSSSGDLADAPLHGPGWKSSFCSRSKSRWIEVEQAFHFFPSFSHLVVSGVVQRNVSPVPEATNQALARIGPQNDVPHHLSTSSISEDDN